MREHLYRGKSTSDGRWIESKSVFFSDDGKCEMLFGYTNYRIAYEVMPETVGEYTGLTDKNGKKIFEGDILQGTIVSQWAKEKIKCEVIFERGCFVCVEQTPSRAWQHKLKFAKDIEVIGNIHETLDKK